jgi:hypothetical protein
VAGPPGPPTALPAAVAALAACAPPVWVVFRTDCCTLIDTSPRPSTATLAPSAANRACQYLSRIIVVSAAALNPASTVVPARLRLLKFFVVWNATVFGTALARPGSAAAVSCFSSSARTAASRTPARAAAAICFFTAARLARSASVTDGIAASRAVSNGRRSEERTIRSTVFLSRAAWALGAVFGAAWCSRAFICSLLWLYSSGMPIRCPYSWAAITFSSAV